MECKQHVERFMRLVHMIVDSINKSTGVLERFSRKHKSMTCVAKSRGKSCKHGFRLTTLIPTNSDKKCMTKSFLMARQLTRGDYSIHYVTPFK